MDRIRSIVVPTDFSALAEAAAVRAANLARLEGAQVHLVHAVAVPLVADPYGSSLPTHLGELWEALRQAAQEQLEQTRKTIEAKGVAVTTQVSDSLDPVGSIAEAVRLHSADLIVMGTHGRRGLQRAFLGSVTERALSTLDRPILAVKEESAVAAKPISKIVLAVDFSPHSDRAVEAAASLAARLSASVDVVHAFDLPADYNPYLSAAGTEVERKIESNILGRLEAIREQLGQRDIRVHTHFRRGHPDTVITDLATQIGCQLIVMGTRGLTGLEHVLLGSVAERTLRMAPCSVLCVKAPASSRSPIR
ncbi:MAG TPA: universal stress protein [Myxococcota bacterium]|nr:universal stress protein [Myxococcota bacterium]